MTARWYVVNDEARVEVWRGMAADMDEAQEAARVQAGSGVALLAVEESGPDGDRCATCGAPHEGQDCHEVFTDEQLAGAVAFCCVCGWPEFDADDARRQS